MQTTSTHPDRPGWGIIDRYMPDATPEAQEEAYENLKGLAHVLFQIDERVAQEEIDIQPPLF